MAKGKYQKWLEPDNLELLKGWAREGLRDEDIAAKMGIAASTLYQWKKDHAEISDALKEGKEVVDFKVENALLSAALEGNVTAQIFWLKNRKPRMWRDKPVETAPDDAPDDGFLDALKEEATDVWQD